MIIHQLKRHFNRPVSYLLYAVLITYFLISGTLLNRDQLSALAVDIAIVDYADNAVSRHYIESLNSYQILTLYKTDQDDANDLLRREVVDAIMIIPKSYNPNQRGTRIGYYHLQTNVIAPAIIDLLAVNLMPEIAKYRLVKAAERYGVGDRKSALSHFDKYQKTVREQLDVAVLPIGNRNSSYREQALIVVNNARKHLLFSIFIIALCMALPLSTSLTTNAATLRRIAISPRGIGAYALSERIISYPYLLLPWLIVCASLVNTVKNTDSLLLFAGSIVIIGYFEAFKLLFNQLKSKSTASLAALLVLVVPALLGGVFFDSDLLPKNIHELSRMLPFNLLESIFYVELSTSVNTYHYNTVFAHSLILVGLIGLNSLSLKWRSND